MELTKEYNDLDLTISISGQVDTNTAPDLEKFINKELTRAKSVKLDFAKVEYISSAGLRVLLSAYKKLNEKKAKFEIVNANSDVKSILEMTGFTSFLIIS